MTEDDKAGAASGAASGSGPGPRARLGRDFATRLVSGIVMAVIAAAFTYWGTLPFAFLVLVVALLLSWEWGRLVHGGSSGAAGTVHLGTVAIAAALAASNLFGLGLLALPIGAILAVLLTLGQNSFFSALGVFYAGLPAAALIWLRGDEPYGLLAVTFLILIVVTADTAAFLAGRLIGGAKLWPRVSPNKTWAGLIGAVGASAVVGAVFALVATVGSPVRLAVAGALLAVVAQAGDLAESAIKRRFGAKDAGTLIPGHGGVMDRVDGLVAASTAVAFTALVINVHAPAQALLIGS